MSWCRSTRITFRCIASRRFSPAGIELHRSTLADWVGKASFHLRPVVDCLAAELKRSGKLGMDETTVRVLDPGRGKTKTGYMWTMVRDERPWCGADPPGVVYRYAPSRGGKHGEKLLEGFSGTAGACRGVERQYRGGAYQQGSLWRGHRGRISRACFRCRLWRTVATRARGLGTADTGAARGDPSRRRAQPGNRRAAAVSRRRNGRWLGAGGLPRLRRGPVPR